MKKWLSDRKKPILIILILIISVLGLIAYNKNQNQSKDINSTTVEKGDLKKTLMLSGEIDAGEKVTLKFQTGGKLNYVSVKEGDRINKGQLVAQLDQRSVQKNLERALNDFKTARWDLDQAKDDVEGSALTEALQRTIDQSQFTLDNEIIDVELQNLSIEFSKLFSPIAGVLVSTSAPLAGVNVSPSDTFEIVNPDTIVFKASVDQNDVAMVKEGMEVEIIIDAYPDEKVKGVVDSISFTPKSDETGTVYTISLKISQANDAMKYRIGMTGDAEFVVNEVNEVLYIPSEYLQEDEDGKTYVYTSSDKDREKVFVETGIETDESVEINKGLKEGDTVWE